VSEEDAEYFDDEEEEQEEDEDEGPPRRRQRIDNQRDPFDTMLQMIFTEMLNPQQRPQTGADRRQEPFVRTFQFATSLNPGEQQQMPPFLRA